MRLSSAVGSSEPAEKLIRIHNFDFAEGSKRRQVRIAGYNPVRSGLDGAFQDSIILRIVQDGLDSPCRLDEIGQILDLSHQGVDNSRLKLELLALQNSLDLLQDVIRDGNFDQAFDS